MSIAVDLQQSLRITEIFYSLQGECNAVGWPTVFVRLTGCPLRCHYCDTAYAFSGGEIMTICDVYENIKQYSCQRITITGGEPLAQENSLSLIRLLLDSQYQVSIETSGALPINKLDKRVNIVLDLKTPASGEMQRNLISNIEYLKSDDQIKFVINDMNDYNWSKEIISKYQLNDVCDVIMSPVYENLRPEDLADWILNDQLSVRFQIQLHKLLWKNEPGH